MARFICCWTKQHSRWSLYAAWSDDDYSSWVWWRRIKSHWYNGCYLTKIIERLPWWDGLSGKSLRFISHVCFAWVMELGNCSSGTSATGHPGQNQEGSTQSRYQTQEPWYIHGHILFCCFVGEGLGKEVWAKTEPILTWMWPLSLPRPSLQHLSSETNGGKTQRNWCVERVNQLQVWKIRQACSNIRFQLRYMY